MSHDVIVVGSGAAGLTAAIVLARAGLKVVVVEKANVIGGSSAWSLGALWIPNNPHMQDIGQADSPELAHTYLREVLGTHYDYEHVAAFVESGSAMIRYLESSSTVRFFAVPVPDYYPDLKGAAIGRSLWTAGMRGDGLGPFLKLIRRPLRGLVAFKSMQVEPWDFDKLKNALRTWVGFRFALKRVATFMLDLMRFGTGGYLANGNALVGSLLKTALDCGVQVHLSTRAVQLIVENNSVIGITVKDAQGARDLRSHRAVFLASGGFGMNERLIQDQIPTPAGHISVQPAENEGDGISMALQTGAALATANIDNATWTPVSVLRDKAGCIIAKYPHFGSDRAKPGSIVVGPDANRFVNEASPYQSFVRAMHRSQVDFAYLIGDHTFLHEWGMGLAIAGPLSIRSLFKAGYLVAAGSLSELATKIGLDPQQLTHTVSAFNEQARLGIDRAYQRGESAYDRIQGDPNQLPCPNLRALEDPPYYAVKLHRGNAGTSLGLRTTLDAEVLRTDQSIQPGLYAIGLDRNSVFSGAYPGGGAGLGPAMTFAFRAAQHVINNLHAAEPRTSQ